MRFFAIISVMLTLACGAASPPVSDGGTPGACTIGGVGYASGVAQPGSPCQICAPQVSATSWTPAPDLLACDAGTGTYCQSGACVDACVIGGAIVAANTVNPSDTCEVCDPPESSNAWATSAGCTPDGGDGGPQGCGADGTPCSANGGTFCLGNVCLLACDIAGSVIDAGLLDSSGCESCQPAISQTTYTPLTDGTQCSTSGGNLCASGVCVAACLIAGTVVGAHSFEATTIDACCNPDLSTTTWTPGFRLSQPIRIDNGAITALATDQSDSAAPSDLVFGTSTGTVEALFGQSDGGFLASQIVVSGAPVSAIAFADMNGDGFADVGCLAGTAPTLYTQQQNGGFNNAGTWPAIPDASGLWAVNVGVQTQMMSFNRDFSGFQPPATLVPQVDQGGTLVAETPLDLDYIYTSSVGYGPPISFAQGSLTSPGSTDVMVYTDMMGGSFFFELDAGWQQLLGMDHNAFAAGGPVMAMADVTGDGRSDVVSGGGPSLTLFVNQPYFGEALLPASGTVAPAAANFTGVALAAFSGDGGTQIAASDNGNGAVYLFIALFPYDGGLTLTGSYTTPNPGQLAVGDFNGDGRPDIAVAAGGTIQILQRQCP